MSNIPEGATHENVQYFYKIIGNDVYIHDEDDWVLTITDTHWALKNLTPLQPKQWIPEVGQECEYQDPTGQGIVRLPPDNNGVLIVEEGGIYKRVEASECKPIKTEREKFVDDNKHDMYLNAINESQLISMPQSTGEDLAKIVLGYIYDKGARFND